MRRQTSQTAPVHAEPLHKAENAWVAPKKSELSEVERISKEVKGVLNKVTAETFDKLSEKIANIGVETEEILTAVIEIIFDKALEEPGFNALYARLCQFLMLRLPQIQDWIAADSKSNVFRRLLLKKCQTEFENSAKWAAEDQQSAETRRQARLSIDTLTDEEKLALAEEDYQRQKLKRRSLSNTQFVGELYKIGMISDNIIHRCIHSLLASVENPEEEEVESLCKLMTTVGSMVDQRSKQHMDSYIVRMEELSVHKQLPSRIRFMVLDVLDL
ncbi:armadillo-type protein, partial [Gorgonomyces haynaldii]